ncbi:T9SS type A sorting domain-containing protein [Flavobacteriaceae sp. LMIT009]
MKTSITLVFTILSFVSSYSQAVNDECTDAESIVVTTASQLTITPNTDTATQSLQSSCESGSFTWLDVWYEFTMPVDGNVRITAASNLDYFTLYDSCGGSELICLTGNSFFYNLLQGTTYVLRMSNRDIYAGANSFNIQAFETAANDECVDAEVLSVTTVAQLSVTPNTMTATQSLQSSCESGSFTWLDVWYEFTMPVNGNVRITGASNLDYFTLYDGCGGSELSCLTGNSFFYNLSQGSTYVLRMSNRDIYSGGNSFNIQAFETAANDECVDAEVLSVTTGSQLSVTPNTMTATQSLQSSCESPSNTWLDVWYEFTMPVNGNVRITGASNLDYFNLYDSCGGSELSCLTGNSFFYNLSQGSTYVLRMSNRSIYAGANNFNIQAFETAANDECLDAEVLSVTTGSQLSVTPNTMTATQSLQSSCESGSFTWLDVWYEFTMPVNGNVRITGASNLDYFTLYDSCGGSEISCRNGNQFLYDLNQGTTYTLRMSNRSIYAGTNSFNMQVFEKLANYNCANAETIQVAPFGECATINITVDLRSGLLASSNGTCNSSSARFNEAWYTFEAPITGNISLDTNSGFNYFVVYDTCNGSEITCFNNDGLIPVVFGETYLMQVYMSDTLAGNATFCMEGSYNVSQGVPDVCENLPIVNISASSGNTNQLVPILDGSGDIVAAINANGNDLGDVNATLFIENADTRIFSGQHYLRREISIATQNSPISNVQVRLYLLEDEVNDLIIMDSNLSSIIGLEVMKVSGTDCTSGYTAGGDFILTNVNNFHQDYYQVFSTNSFSVFYPTSTNFNSLKTQELDKGDLKIYPTITDDKIYITSDLGLEKVRVSIIDINGRILRSQFISINNSSFINISTLSDGLYFVNIEKESASKTFKVIKN